jgi:branched-chain amino acid transport system ATP-binding protein
LIVKQIFDAIRELNRTSRSDRVPRRAERVRRAEAAESRLRDGQRQGDDVGPSKELLANPEVRAAYLEGGHDDDVCCNAEGHDAGYSLRGKLGS